MFDILHYRGLYFYVSFSSVLNARESQRYGARTHFTKRNADHVRPKTVHSGGERKFLKFPNRTNHAARVGTQACIHKCLQMRCPLALMFLLPLRLAGRTSYKWDMLVCMLVYRFFVALMCSGTIFCPFPLPGSNPEAPGRRVLKYGRPDRMVFTVGGYIRVYVCE